MKKTLSALVCLCAAALLAAPRKSEKPASHQGKHDEHSEMQAGPARKMTAAAYGPERTTPLRKGEFTVALVVITFPECVRPESPDAVLEALSRVDGGTVTGYYKDYSQGITWPVLTVYPDMYMAPEPFGYYCRNDRFTNPAGYAQDGGARVQKLRQNRPMRDDESSRWPLDIAIIDGLGDGEDTFHAVFPDGKDRGRNGLSGMRTLSELLYRTNDAMLMFYRP